MDISSYLASIFICLLSTPSLIFFHLRRPSPAGFSASSVVLWDDLTGTRIFHIQLPSPINSICCRIDTLVITTSPCRCSYNMKDSNSGSVRCPQGVLLDGKLVLYRLSSDFSSVSPSCCYTMQQNPLLCPFSAAGEAARERVQRRAAGQEREH